MYNASLSRSSRSVKVKVTVILDHYDLFAMSIIGDYNVQCHTVVEEVFGEESEHKIISFNSKVNLKYYVSDYITDSIAYFLGYTSWREVFDRYSMFRSEAEDTLNANRFLYDSLIRSILALGPEVISHIICYCALTAHLDTKLALLSEDSEEFSWIKENILVHDSVSKLIDELKYDLLGFKRDDRLKEL